MEQYFGTDSFIIVSGLYHALQLHVRKKNRRNEKIRFWDINILEMKRACWYCNYIRLPLLSLFNWFLGKCAAYVISAVIGDVARDIVAIAVREDL